MTATASAATRPAAETTLSATAGPQDIVPWNSHDAPAYPCGLVVSYLGILYVVTACPPSGVPGTSAAIGYTLLG